MARYRIRHLTRYTYEERVPVCHNLAHLSPRPSPGHEWHSSTLAVEPHPAVRSQRVDFFGNQVTYFAMQEPHRELDVIAESEVTVAPGEGVRPAITTPWEAVRDLFLSADRTCDPHPLADEWIEAVQYTFESPYIRWPAEVAEFARASFPAGRGVVDAVLDLCQRIYDEFAYDSRTTTITTTLSELMKVRAGVCQDFAHLGTACLRSVGIPARYVSGYLLTTPPPGQARLVGADASHAWLSAFIPGWGWLDVDPTNDVIPGEKHIRIAWGRDFGDVSPLRGVVLGGGHHEVQVSVDVAPMAENQQPASGVPAF